MPGSRFKEFIDRAFLGNRGYDYQTGQWNRQGVTEGLIGGIGNAIVPGAGTLGRFIYDRAHNRVGQPTQVGLNNGGSYTPPSDFSGYSLNPPDVNIQYGTDGGMTPDMTQFNVPGATYTPPDWNSYLQKPDLTIKTGNGGGTTGGYSGFSGNSSGGTLGGGYVVDPSQWGMFGLGGDSGPVNGGTGPGYQLQLMSGGMHEGGGAGGGTGTGLAAFMARRNGTQTGGGLPAQSPTAFTGGGLPAYLQPPVKPGGGGQIGG
jgi:hypothetical protein